MRQSLPVSVQNLVSIDYASRFFSVGIVGAIFDNVVLFSIVELTRVSPILAKGVSAELSIVLMFLINEYWTFSGHGKASSRAFLRRLATSNVVRFGGLAVGLVGLYVFHNLLGLWYLFANVLGIGLGFVVNYVFEGVFTWRVS